MLNVNFPLILKNSPNKKYTPFQAAKLNNSFVRIDSKHISDISFRGDNLSVLTYDANIGSPIGPKSRKLNPISLEGITEGTSIYDYPAFKKADSLNHVITTSGLWQCAALVIINKKEGWHYLAHVTATTGSEDILNNFKDNKINPKGCDIYVLPGIEKQTKYTVGEILTALETVDKNLPEKVQFVHFAPDVITVASYNGDVWAVKGGCYFPSGGEMIELSGNYKRNVWKA